MDGAEGPCRTVHSPPGSRVASYFWLLHDRGDRRDRLLVRCFATTATSGGRMEHQTTETPKLGDSAGTAEPQGGLGVRRSVEGTHREDSGAHNAAPVAAAKQRARNLRGPVAPEAYKIAPREAQSRR